jgi:hypothetical protein
MGSTLFDLCINHAGDVFQGITIIDKVNKLVKYNMIESESLWRDLRKARNHLSHEYPARPDLLVMYINQTFELSKKLLACHDKIKQYLLNC